MADIYIHDQHDFSSRGLQLRTTVDRVPPNQYARLTNLVPFREGQLEGRAGLQYITNVANTTTPGSGMHTLGRLNQLSVAGVGDRIAGVDTTVQTFALPAGTVAVSRDTSRTGDPLSMSSFHFQNDTSAWVIISDRAGMRKYKGGPGSGLYQNLGIAPPAATPVNAATAVDGGAGNLNNTGGPGYDWRYTYVNTITNTESNPSDLNIVPSYSHASTVLTNPDPGFGGGGAGVFILGNSAAEVRQSFRVSGWPATTLSMQQLTLYVQFTQVNTVGTLGGTAFGCVEVSLDGGSNWILITDCMNYTLPNGGVLTMSLPVNQDMTKVILRAVALGVGNTTVPQNVMSRRIRERAGNFNLAGLLTGGGGNAVCSFNMIGCSVTGIDITQTATLLPLVNRQANVTMVASNDTQCNAVRLYRRGGSITGGWAFVQQYPMTAGSGSFTVTDNVADTDLGSFIEFTNDAPVTSVYTVQRQLPRTWGPCFNPARYMGCGDPDRPGAVYFSNPGNCDQWGVGQWMDTSSPSDPMQDGCVFNTRVFAFSKEKMFEILPAIVGGATFQPFPTACARGLISPYGLIQTARAIYFIAKDGIYVTTGGPEQSLVENSIKPLFPTQDYPTGRAVEGYQAIDFERIEDLRLIFHNDELWFIYRGLDGSLHTLAYDQMKDRWRAIVYADGAVAVTDAYSEEAGPASSLLLGDASGAMYTTAAGQGDVLQASTHDIALNFRTGAFDQGDPLMLKEYGTITFDLDPGGATLAKPVTITPLLDGETITDASITVTGSGRKQVNLPLGDVFARNINFDVTAVKNATINPLFFKLDILWRNEPTPVVHWETRESSSAIPGWMHIRDMYVAYRSTAAVVLTVTFDNNYTQTYTLPTTAGAKLKTYVPFTCNKFKMARFQFDSADPTLPFRLYQDDIEVRMKPWLTQLGYSIQKPFGGEAPSATAWFQAKLLGGR